MRASRLDALRELSKLYGGYPVKISKYVSPYYKGTPGYLYHFSLKIGPNDPIKQFIPVTTSTKDPEQLLVDNLFGFIRQIKRYRERVHGR